MAKLAILMIVAAMVLCAQGVPVPQGGFPSFGQFFPPNFQEFFANSGNSGGFEQGYVQTFSSQSGSDGNTQKSFSAISKTLPGGETKVETLSNNNGKIAHNVFTLPQASN